MAEKGAFARNDKLNNSYAGRAISELLQENIGRFRKLTDPSPIPTYPKASDWSTEVVGPEPPLGYSIDEMAVCGDTVESASVVASGTGARPDLAAPSPTHPDVSSAGPVTPKPLIRRLVR
jgi:hypothetical protein